MARDYYEVLGVPKNASDMDVRAAYRRLARKHHPDVNPGNPKAEAIFKEINAAYEVLSYPEKRRPYDRFGPNWKQAQQSGVGFPGGAAPGGWPFQQGGPGVWTSRRGPGAQGDQEDLFNDQELGSVFQRFFS